MCAGAFGLCVVSREWGVGGMKGRRQLKICFVAMTWIVRAAEKTFQEFLCPAWHGCDSTVVGSGKDDVTCVTEFNEVWYDMQTWVTCVIG